jgi:hypothetical protein
MSNVIDNIDDEGLDKLYEIKKGIASSLDRQNVVDIIRELIQNSSCISFISERAAKFISPTRPMLQLQLDLEAAQKAYPNAKDLYQSKISKSFKAEDAHRKVCDARKIIVRDEVVVKFVDIIIGTFMYIVNGEIPKNYLPYADKIYSLIQDKDVERLRGTITNIFPKRDKEGNVIDPDLLGFLFSATSGIHFAPVEANLDNDTEFLLEFMY